MRLVESFHPYIQICRSPLGLTANQYMCVRTGRPIQLQLSEAAPNHPLASRQPPGAAAVVRVVVHVKDGVSKGSLK